MSPPYIGEAPTPHRQASDPDNGGIVPQGISQVPWDQSTTGIGFGSTPDTTKGLRAFPKGFVQQVGIPLGHLRGFVCEEPLQGEQ